MTAVGVMQDTHTHMMGRKQYIIRGTRVDKNQIKTQQ